MNKTITSKNITDAQLMSLLKSVLPGVDVKAFRVMLSAPPRPINLRKMHASLIADGRTAIQAAEICTALAA